MEKDSTIQRGLLFSAFAGLILLGTASFIYLVNGHHPETAWRAYHINFLLWSAIAQGGLLFSMVMHVAKARWSGPLARLSESFAAFFPISFVLFLILFLGRESIFPWLHHDLHGKEVWLNMPFLFTRDAIGLLILYGLGFAYLTQVLRLSVNPRFTGGGLRSAAIRLLRRGETDGEVIRWRMTVFAVLYMLAYASVLSLIGFDLVMSMDPHWISTLFGAYSFVKAFYIGLGALLVLASAVWLTQGDRAGLTPDHFHDLGKLFFGFCLVWADFFYCQFVVIWYGNLPEEAAYVIERTMTLPWQSLAWAVFILCFVVPFFILLNRAVKRKPAVMMVLASAIIVGIWLEHLLLLGPTWHGHPAGLPLGIWDALITLGFFGLMAAAVTAYLNLFPELVRAPRGEVH